MTNTSLDLREFHWLIDMLQTIEVGLVVLDRDFRIQMWNGFMENHSGRSANALRDTNLFDSFPELPRSWIERKCESVVMLKTRAFTSWEQRPYLFRFHNTRPITGMESFMYQNITFCPLTSTDGSVSHICLLIYDVTDVASSRRQLERVNAQLEHLSQIDRLTGLYNRGTWESFLANEFERYRRYQHTCALIMFDIDHFKAVNDTHGHQAGDEVIRHTAQVVRDNLRQTDLGGRYGGEEFGIILPETDRPGAWMFAERIRESIETSTVRTSAADIRYTVSLGISVLNPEIPDYNAWLELADQALYRAKEGGRNQVQEVDGD